MLKELPYYAKWFFDCKLGGQRKPLQTVLFITDRCNLHCRHCNVVTEGPYVSTMTFSEVAEHLNYSYLQGSRIVDFEGGEPHLWRDRAAGADLNDLIELAREMGFFETTVTTNAQGPITAKSDLIWISLDGLERGHDDQRGPGTFAKALRNIDACDHPNLNVNMCVTARNLTEFKEVAQLVRDHPKLHRMSFSFYTPYDGRELLPTPAQRNQVIDQALELKRAGYPIMNSAPGLELMRDPQRFLPHKACWISNFITTDGTRVPGCPGEQADVCDDCGFGMGPEMSLLFRLHPAMVAAGLSVRS